MSGSWPATRSSHSGKSGSAVAADQRADLLTLDDALDRALVLGADAIDRASVRWRLT